jgi:glucokinase
MRLVADVGGTNVRFALADAKAVLTARSSALVSSYTSLEEAIAAYLAFAGVGAGDVQSVAIGAAGPVSHGLVKLTNAPWQFAEGDVSAALNGVPVSIVNDLEAGALALPHLGPEDLTVLGGIAPKPEKAQRMLAVNAGTGFGAATIIKHRSGWLTCPSEAGHMTGWRGVSEPANLAALPLLTVEDVLSGRGVEALYASLQTTAGETWAKMRAADIFTGGAHDTAAAKCVRVFGQALGHVCGDLALAVTAWDGVFLFGSVAAGWANAADVPAFRTAFEAKGAMQAKMRLVPTALVHKQDAALFGLAHLQIDHRN